SRNTSCPARTWRVQRSAFRSQSSATFSSSDGGAMRVPCDGLPSLHQGRTRSADGPCTDRRVWSGRRRLVARSPLADVTARARAAAVSAAAASLSLKREKWPAEDSKKIVPGECCHSPDKRGNQIRA